MAFVTPFMGVPWRAFDSNGDPIVGYAYFYEAGTTTPVTVYSDAALSVAHPSPLPSSAAGVFPAIYGAEDVYKVDVQDSEGASIPGFPLDDIAILAWPVGVAAGGTGAATAAGARTNLAVLGTAGGTMTGDINLGDNSLTNVDTIDFDTGGASGDYIKWVTAQGLYGYENGVETFRLGVSSVTTRFPNVYSNTTASAANCYVSTDGSLLRSTSRGEFKVNRVDIAQVPEVIAKQQKTLRPFSFESTHPVDKGRRFLGFDALEVAATFPDAAIYDDEGNAINYDVRALVAILWQENEDREAEIADLRARIEALGA